MGYITCPSCNEDNPDNRLTCIRCGSLLSSPPKPAPAKPPKKTIFNDRWRAFLVLSPAAVLVIGLLVSGLTNDGGYVILAAYLWLGVLTAALWVRRLNASQWKYHHTALRIFCILLSVLSVLAWPFLILPVLLPGMGMLAPADNRPAARVSHLPVANAGPALKKPTGIAAAAKDTPAASEPPAAPVSDAARLIAEIIDAPTIVIGSEIRQQERIDALVAMGAQVIPEIDTALERFLSTWQGRAIFQYQNAGTLCEALGKIGGTDARQKLLYYTDLRSNVYEYRYIREGAQRGLKHFEPPAAPVASTTSPVPNEENSE